jgi:hypothetical protein
MRALLERAREHTVAKTEMSVVKPDSSHVLTVDFQASPPSAPSPRPLSSPLVSTFGPFSALLPPELLA